MIARVGGHQALRERDLGNVNQKLPKSNYHCDMCKKYYMSHPQYVYETFEILPKFPKHELIICEKCARRESKLKKKDKIPWEVR